MSQRSIQPNDREGNAELIRGVCLFDSPDPITGNFVMGCSLPGDGVAVIYPGCDPCIDKGQMEILSADGGLDCRARLKASAIELKDGEVRFHPPSSQPMIRAAARVCEKFGIDFRDPLAPMKLLSALIERHYPEALRPAGKELSSDERAMSIAWVVDQGRQDKEPSSRAIERARPILLAENLIEVGIKDSTLKRLFREGQSLLRQHGVEPWRKCGRGRPAKNSTRDKC